MMFNTAREKDNGKGQSDKSSIHSHSQSNVPSLMIHKRHTDRVRCHDDSECSVNRKGLNVLIEVDALAYYNGGTAKATAHYGDYWDYFHNSS